MNEAQAQFDGPVIPAVDQLIVDINQEGREDIKYVFIYISISIYIYIYMCVCVYV